MKDIIESFTPADVSIDNALQFVEAIEKAVREGIHTLPVEDRSIVIGIISGALAQTSESLAGYRKILERQGRADPVTEDQKEQLRLLLRKTIAKSKPES